MTLPNTINLNLMRSQANALMSTSVSVYSVSVNYTAYGQQVPTSGLLYTATGYTGNITGKDQELLNQMGYDGTVKESFITILLPVEYDIDTTNIIRTQNTDYRVVWHNKNTQSSVKIYTKALCALYDVEQTKRRLT